METVVKVFPKRCRVRDLISSDLFYFPLQVLQDELQDQEDNVEQMKMLSTEICQKVKRSVGVTCHPEKVTECVDLRPRNSFFRSFFSWAVNSVDLEKENFKKGRLKMLFKGNFIPPVERVIQPI